MGGLIPLVLASGSRASFISPSPPPMPRQTHQRSASTGSTPTPAIKPRPVKRYSHAPPISLPVLPYTPAEWKRAISDIKRQHLTKRYRACSTRCVEILDNIKDTSQVEPVYIIYLHFYAATSMELCARTLPPHSPSRSNLLQQAQTHFDRAAALIDTAEDSVVSRTRNGSVSSSGSSCHSPAGSICSRAATPDTRLSSPTNSVLSFEDLKVQTPITPPPVKRVKKVSFSLPHEETIRIPEPVRIPSPIVRPDSPTLGFDDEYFQAGAARQDLPEPPKTLKFQEIEFPLQPVSETEPLQLIPEDDGFLMARSVDRFCDNLSALRTQLSRHSASVNELLSAAASNERLVAPRSLLFSEFSARSGAATPDGELRKMDRQARIERLRKNGWQRKRFDARRYEELCETVMSELS